MGSEDRTVASIDFILDAEGRDIAVLIDAIEASEYKVDWLVNGDESEPDAYIIDPEEETVVEYDQQLGVEL